MNPWSSLESQGTCVSAFGSHWNQHAFVVDIEHLLVNIRVPWIQLLLTLCRLVKAGFSNLAVLTGASDSARFFLSYSSCRTQFLLDSVARTRLLLPVVNVSSVVGEYSSIDRAT